jgi:protocatechuate 3,4-dioxygenase beta subunit
MSGPLSSPATRAAWSRRGVFGLMGAAGISAIAACAPGSTPIASEEVGPFPEDLSGNAAFYRTNITEGKPGVPLSVALTFVNSNANLAKLSNLRVDIWQCDKDGVYSGYVNSGVNAVGKTYLRGIQLSNLLGMVKFQTIYPGWYSGRITHLHIQVRRSGKLLKTTQLAFPQNITKAVYASSLYKAHGQNTTIADFAHDHVFADGTGTEMLTLTGSVAAGYAASLTVGIAA